MKIAFDYQIFTLQSYGGISRYYKILAEELLKLGQEVKVFAGFHRNNYIDDLSKGIVKGKKMNKFLPKSDRAFQWINNCITKVQMKNWQPDIIHETYYSGLSNLKTDAVRVTSVYDMIHELFSDQFLSSDKTTQFKKNTLKSVDHIISISHNTKRDLVELFDLDWKKYVIHNKDFIRPTDLLISVGDATKANEKLCWSAKSKMSDVIRMMISELLIC